MLPSNPRSARQVAPLGSTSARSGMHRSRSVARINSRDDYSPASDFTPRLPTQDIRRQRSAASLRSSKPQLSSQPPPMPSGNSSRYDAWTGTTDQDSNYPSLRSRRTHAYSSSSSASASSSSSDRTRKSEQSTPRTSLEEDSRPIKGNWPPKTGSDDPSMYMSLYLIIEKLCSLHMLLSFRQWRRNLDWLWLLNLEQTHDYGRFVICQRKPFLGFQYYNICWRGYVNYTRNNIIWLMIGNTYL